MRALTELQRRLAYIACAVGIVMGGFGAVRLGSIVIAFGTATIASTYWFQENKRRRIIECYFPLAFAAALLVVAAALPKGL